MKKKRGDKNMETFKMMKKIGIETFGDLEMFKKEVLLKNETIEQGLLRYIKELGTNFKIKGE
jgi:hypothetical protein